MRIRKAALAGVTALAVAFTGTSVATAADAPAPEKASLSAKLGKPLEADKPADGREIFGTDDDVSSQPTWAPTLNGVGIAAAVITVLGGLVGPVLNFIKYGPVDFKF